MLLAKISGITGGFSNIFLSKLS